MKNKYPQKCEKCGLIVGVGQGQTYKRGPKNWVTYHDICPTLNSGKGRLFNSSEEDIKIRGWNVEVDPDLSGIGDPGDFGDND